MAGLTRFLVPSEVMREDELILTPGPYRCYIVTRWVWVGVWVEVMPLGRSQAHGGVEAHTQTQVHAQRASSPTAISAPTKVDSAGSDQRSLAANAARIHRWRGSHVGCERAGVSAAAAATAAARWV